MVGIFQYTYRSAADSVACYPMRKTEIIRLIREKATEICDTTTERVVGGTHGNSEVEARILTIQYARRQGISNEDIALAWLRDSAGDQSLYPSKEALRNKAKTIRCLFNSYSEHCLQSKAFRYLSQEMKKFCEETFKEEI